MQNDFVLCDKFSKTLKIDIEKTLEMGYNDICHEVINSSDITKCDRRIYYKLVGVKCLDNKSKQLHHIHINNKWEVILKKVKSFELLNKNLTVADHNYNIVSNIDFTGKINDVGVIVMVKEVDEQTFKNNKAKRADVIELITQIWLVEANDGFLIYEDYLTKRISIFHILSNVSVLNAVKDKLIVLRDCKNLGVLPERKYETPNSDECKECGYVEKCWRKKGNG